jgi:hypothetical protein
MRRSRRSLAWRFASLLGICVALPAQGQVAQPVRAAISQQCATEAALPAQVLTDSQPPDPNAAIWLAGNLRAGFLDSRAYYVATASLQIELCEAGAALGRGDLKVAEAHMKEIGLYLSPIVAAHAAYVRRATNEKKKCLALAGKEYAFIGKSENEETALLQSAAIAWAKYQDPSGQHLQVVIANLRTQMQTAIDDYNRRVSGIFNGIRSLFMGSHDYDDLQDQLRTLEGSLNTYMRQAYVLSAEAGQAGMDAQIAWARQRALAAQRQEAEKRLGALKSTIVDLFTNGDTLAATDRAAASLQDRLKNLSLWLQSEPAELGRAMDPVRNAIKRNGQTFDVAANLSCEAAPAQRFTPSVTRDLRWGLPQ